MFKLTFLGPSQTMNAGGLEWTKGESRELDDQIARDLVRRYKYAQWELEEIVVKTKRRTRSRSLESEVEEEPEEVSPSWAVPEEVTSEEEPEE